MITVHKQHIIAYVYYWLVVIWMTYPLIRLINTHFLGSRFSDAYEYAHHIWWIKYALSHRLPVLSMQLLAYPEGLNAAWLWGNPLQSFPAWLLLTFTSLPLAYNLSFLFHLSLNGWATYWLCWRLTHAYPSALIGGTILAIYPAVQGHLIGSHVGLLTLWGGIFYVITLIRLQYARDARNIIATALCFTLSILGNNLLLIYITLPITSFFVLKSLINHNRLWFRRIILSGCIGFTLSMIFITPVILNQYRTPVAPFNDENREYHTDLLAFVAPSFYNPFFSHLKYTRKILGEEKNVEGSAYIGIIGSLLTGIALVSHSKARSWGILALIMAVLALGSHLKIVDQIITFRLGNYATSILLPWAWISQLPVLNITRTPARFNLMVGISIAVMTAYGSQVVFKRLSQNSWYSWGVCGILITCIAFDYQILWQFPLPNAAITFDLKADAITHVAQQADIRAIFNIPYNHLLTSKDAMHLQTRHQKPIIAGHVTRQTPVSAAKLSILQNTLDHALLDASNIDMLILMREWADSNRILENYIHQQIGIPFYMDDHVKAWRIQPTSVSPTFTYYHQKDDVTYMYIPEDGLLQWQALLHANHKTIIFYLDHEPLDQWYIVNHEHVEITMTITQGYHTLSLGIQDQCPDTVYESLKCPHFQIINTKIEYREIE